MSKLRDQVAAFHREAGAPILDVPTVPNQERQTLRLRLIAEEFCELLEAANLGNTAEHVMAIVEHDLRRCVPEMDLVDTVDALGDLQYVIQGCYLELGVRDDEITDEIHRSNLTKFPCVTREDGKILKPETYSRPRLADVLYRQGWNGMVRP